MTKYGNADQVVWIDHLKPLTEGEPAFAQDWILPNILLIIAHLRMWVKSRTLQDSNLTGSGIRIVWYSGCHALVRPEHRSVLCTRLCYAFWHTALVKFLSGARQFQWTQLCLLAFLVFTCMLISDCECRLLNLNDPFKQNIIFMAPTPQCCADVLDKYG